MSDWPIGSTPRPREWSELRPGRRAARGRGPPDLPPRHQPEVASHRRLLAEAGARGVALAQPVFVMEARMNHRWFGVTAAVAFACSTPITGQSQSSGVQRSTREQSGTKREISVVGCLQRVDAGSPESATRPNSNAAGASRRHTNWSRCSDMGPAGGEDQNRYVVHR
jgi:hypothetical protein